MFTGIVTDIGRVEAVERRGDLRVRIACAPATAAAELGASIACSGVCLTVVDRGEGWFAVDVSAESVARTAPAAWQPGARLNLERALRVGDELGGHIVTGHVDGLGIVTHAAEEGGSLRLGIAAAAGIAPYLAAKGSITVDGVSLTVNDVSDRADQGAEFGVNIIPHTASATTLGGLTPGAQVNLEIDVLARYLGRMQAIAARQQHAGAASG